MLDRAGWHISDTLIVPDTISRLKLPPHAPEFDPIENVRAYFRDTMLAHRLVKTYEDFVDTCCDAWDDFIADQNTV